MNDIHDQVPEQNDVPSPPRERVAVVTGASSGIGAEVCRLLHDDHYRVLGISRRGPGAGGSFEHRALDLGDRAALEKGLAALEKELESLELLVLAAGIGRFGSLEEFSADQLRRVVEIDLVAPMTVVRFLLPALRRAACARIVFVGSESALRAGRYGSAYSAAKFGLRGFALSLRQELARFGVGVTIVHPGPVRTPFFDELGFEPEPGERHALSAEVVAQAVCYAASAPRHAVIDEIELSPATRVFRKKPPSGVRS